MKKVKDKMQIVPLRYRPHADESIRLKLKDKTLATIFFSIKDARIILVA